MKHQISLFYKSSIEDRPQKKWLQLPKTLSNDLIYGSRNQEEKNKKMLPEVLVITSFPPRECGIATYSYDLIKALNNKFSNSFELKVCALETNNEKHIYSEDVEYILNTEVSEEYYKLLEAINGNNKIKIVMIQHEFGFYHRNENDFKKTLLQAFQM